jgi:predicted translin family RNA/ssDNA-binding protein
MPTANDSLGARLTGFMQQLAEQIDVTRDAQEREKLVTLHRDASRQLQDLIDKTVPTAMREYAQATAALEDANKALREARDDIAKIAKAIEIAGKAISVVAKLVAMI